MTDYFRCGVVNFLMGPDAWGRCNNKRAPAVKMWDRRLGSKTMVMTAIEMCILVIRVEQ